jgi:molybdate transport system ATP-binding protein
MVVRRGGFVLDAALEVADGEVLALLGPNGSGKSTTLGAIAGLLEPESGTVRVGGRTLTSVGGPGPDVAVPVSRRRVGLLGQEPLLFPHLSAMENVAFGGRAQGDGAASARRRAAEWLAAVGLSGFEDRRPPALSGGQRQRVAIARALAARPDALLLDEPMAALDVESAARIRVLMRERLVEAAVTTVLVTHDVVDALVLADRVAILEAGRLVDQGPAARVLARPANRFAAALAGLNLLSGVATELGTVRRADGDELVVDGLEAAPGASVSVAFPPSALGIAPIGEGPENASATAGENSWLATVSGFEPGAGGIRVLLADGSADSVLVAQLDPGSLLAAGISAGSRVVAHVDRAALTVYPRAA